MSLFSCSVGHSGRRSIRAFEQNLVGLGCLESVSYTKAIPTHEKITSCGKKMPQMPLLNDFFLGWVGLGLGSWSVS